MSLKIYMAPYSGVNGGWFIIGEDGQPVEGRDMAFYSKAEVDARDAAMREKYDAVIADLRDAVLNGRGALAEGVLDNDQTNAVLSEIDDAISAFEAVRAPVEKGGE